MLPFCRWQQHELDGLLLEATGQGPWGPYKSAMCRLIFIFEAGYHKQARAAKDHQILLKQTEDLAKVNNLPAVDDLRAAVENGHLDLLSMHQEYAGTSESLPKNV